ncbi:hypothetical protein ERJ70_09490 [Sediminibacillus dalangtanensis]|uniref:Uncharacterized protein n=1 Tax=Sediminibacillus dalangtanensis TaxID=2729421 RepID=A0ABX7VVA1_9BACI|nr:hypothetical protein [Sediminibacillus dalangtanensis]QTM99515.1 hypothetical protein ERJ70_09490 [Sediminibacillus dalangtanensis]
MWVMQALPQDVAALACIPLTKALALFFTAFLYSAIFGKVDPSAIRGTRIIGHFMIIIGGKA